jgi:glucokinase
MIPVVAVDFGGTHLRAAYFPTNEPIPETQIKIRTHAELGTEAVLEKIVEVINSVRPPHLEHYLIGIAAPGPLDPQSGTILKAFNLPGWINIPLGQRMTDKFQQAVVIENDANLAALGEWKHGAGRGYANILYLTISTGIGGGVILNNQLLAGAHGLGAELGHLAFDLQGPLCSCGQHGHIEAIASGTAIARQARTGLSQGINSSLREMSSELEPITTRMIATAAKAGDSFSIRLVEEAGLALGTYMANLVHIFNPGRIILGGGVSQIGETLIDPLCKAMQMQIIHPRYLEGLEVVQAQLGDDAGLIGAAEFARSK